MFLNVLFNSNKSIRYNVCISLFTIKGDNTTIEINKTKKEKNKQTETDKNKDERDESELENYDKQY